MKPPSNKFNILLISTFLIYFQLFSCQTNTKFPTKYHPESFESDIGELLKSETIDTLLYYRLQDFEFTTGNEFLQIWGEYPSYVQIVAELNNRNPERGVRETSIMNRADCEFRITKRIKNGTVNFITSFENKRTEKLKKITLEMKAYNFQNDLFAMHQIICSEENCYDNDFDIDIKIPVWYEEKRKVALAKTMTPTERMNYSRFLLTSLVVEYADGEIFEQ